MHTNVKATLVTGFFFLYCSLSWGAGLKSGPMLGYSAMKEVLIWVQTDGPATVSIKYWEQGKPDEEDQTDPVKTEKKTAFTAKCVADRIHWGITYEYQVFIDGKEVKPQFREGSSRTGPIPLRFISKPKWRESKENQPPDFRVAVGSCAFINEPGYEWQYDPPYGGDYEIFESIYEKSPQLMIWLGDNIYLLEPDWSTRTGIHHRYNYVRSHPYLRALLAGVHQYAIWDDHDFGPDNAGLEFWNKKMTTEAFKLYWGNPSYGLPEAPGIFTFFNWGDVNFYLLDNRTYRTYDQVETKPFQRPKKLLGTAQVDWLVDSLIYNQTHHQFKPTSFNLICIGNQVLSDSGEAENYRSYDREWRYLIDQITRAGIDGVVFLSGDVHFTEFSKEVRYFKDGADGKGSSGKEGKKQIFYDLTVSPLTAKVTMHPPPNSHRIDIFSETENDTITQRNFAVLDFLGPKEDRKMVIRIFDTYGNLINRKEGASEKVDDLWVLRAEDLRAP